MLLLLIKFAVGLLIFATGLSASREDYYSIWRRPGLLARSFLAMYVLVPVVAIAMVLLFDPPHATKLALLCLSVSAGTPLLPKKVLKLGGDLSYAFSLVAATSLAAIATVPASLALLQPLLPIEVQVEIGHIALTILRSFLLPLGAGLLFRQLWPGLAQRLGDPLLRLAGLALAGGALAVIAEHWGHILVVGLPTLLDFAGLTLAALAVGHWLGGPEENHRTCLAVACATRHIGLALLIAGNVRNQDTLALVAAYLFASTLVCVPYVRWRRRVAKLAMASAPRC